MLDTKDSYKRELGKMAILHLCYTFGYTDAIQFLARNWLEKYGKLSNKMMLLATGYIALAEDVIDILETTTDEYTGGLR